MISAVADGVVVAGAVVFKAVHVSVTTAALASMRRKPLEVSRSTGACVRARNF